MYSTLEVIFNEMHDINLRFTYLLTGFVGLDFLCTFVSRCRVSLPLLCKGVENTSADTNWFGFVK